MIQVSSKKNKIKMSYKPKLVLRRVVLKHFQNIFETNGQIQNESL